MCSIMGYCSEAADYEQFRKGFDKTLSRGPDDSRIVDTGKGLLGFHRLAIMGLQPEGMQPFALDGSYVVQRPSNLVTMEGAQLSEAAKAFFDYMVSADAADLIAKAGAVPAVLAEAEAKTEPATEGVK